MGLTIGEKRKVFQGNYLNVWETEFFDKEGQKKYWEWIERRNAIFIFPITPDQKIVLIKNFRVPLERYIIEMPAGLMDKENETEEDTTKRELLEETGYLAKMIIPACKPWPYRSGSSNGISKGFFATGLTKVNDNRGDATEDITVIKIKMEELIPFSLSLPPEILFDINIISMQALAIYKNIKG